MKDMENKDIKLKEGTIRYLQEYIEQKLKERKFDDETLHERLLLLTEEVGELINACRKLTGMNVDEAREITNEAGEELTDVINMIFSVGIKLGFDMEKEFRKKEERIDGRRYKRTSKEID
jgi:NTP pyrophosphatase (non-canonical NTP hydrolase)